MNKLQRILFILLFSFCALAPVTAVYATGTDGSPLTLGNLSDAKTAFGSIGGNMKAIAWYVLLLLIIVAGVMAAFGQQKMAIGVFIGAIIIAAGTYIIGVIASAA